VPELDLGLSEPPAKQDGASADFAREIDEAKAWILELDAQRLELTLEAFELAGQVQRLSLQLFGFVVRLVESSRRSHQVELEDRLPPTFVLLNDVFDDLTNERESPIGLLDGKELHMAECNASVGTPLFFRLALLETAPPAFLRGGEAAGFVFGFGCELRNLERAAVSIDGDEREITRIGVATPAGHELLGLDAHADFH